MGCRSYCHRYRDTVSQRMLYTSDRKHCTVCAIWVPSEYVRCPCCSHMLRTKRRLNHDLRKTKKEKTYRMGVINYDE